jgi:hypothetical protein
VACFACERQGDAAAAALTRRRCSADAVAGLLHEVLSAAALERQGAANVIETTYALDYVLIKHEIHAGSDPGRA